MSGVCFLFRFYKIIEKKKKNDGNLFFFFALVCFANLKITV